MALLLLDILGRVRRHVAAHLSIKDESILCLAGLLNRLRFSTYLQREFGGCLAQSHSDTLKVRPEMPCSGRERGAVTPHFALLHFFSGTFIACLKVLLMIPDKTAKRFVLVVDDEHKELGWALAPNSP